MAARLVAAAPNAFVVAVLGAVIAVGVGAARFGDGTRLPNGMILTRVFDGTWSGRWALRASPRGPPMVVDTEFICFDDRRAFATSRRRGEGGLFDAARGGRVAVDIRAAARLGGPIGPQGGCRGWFSGWIGPALLRDGARPPHAPPCAWRAMGVATTLARSWQGRPCVPAGWPAQRSTRTGGGEGWDPTSNP
ncbi:MAG: hypothetical protein VYD87_14520 [Pseudomonadota bacterium]|nr:hypothetical protein [Pseudomonadota bacterium]MEE3101967.1 hypothetical protein [Pseudomonadota bacterium]